MHKTWNGWVETRASSFGTRHSRVRYTFIRQRLERCLHVMSLSVLVSVSKRLRFHQTRHWWLQVYSMVVLSYITILRLSRSHLYSTSQRLISTRNLQRPFLFTKRRAVMPMAKFRVMPPISMFAIKICRMRTIRRSRRLSKFLSWQKKKSKDTRTLSLRMWDLKVHRPEFKKWNGAIQLITWLQSVTRCQQLSGYGIWQHWSLPAYSFIWIRWRASNSVQTQTICI